MGKLVITTDDIDGSHGAREDIPFSVDGVDYKIDLSDDNYKKLIDMLGPYLREARHIANGNRIPDAIREHMRPERIRAKAERVVGPDTNAIGAALSESARKHTREELDEVNAFIGRHGIPYRGRGAIHSDIWEAWRANDLSLLKEKNRPLALEAAS
jgi:hypothetical protein